ncbi:MAG TPA: YbdD/YjiX family protein [Candidatus Binatia bacterium]|nr:YbdD/YjiX family protein [Candidatus Binatia bacterium]
MKVLRRLWQALRHLSGDDAYERYLAHHRAHHREAAAMTRAQFFRSEQTRKWNSGPQRCC